MFRRKKIGVRRALREITKAVMCEDDEETIVELVCRCLLGAGYLEMDGSYYVPARKARSEKWDED